MFKIYVLAICQLCGTVEAGYERALRLHGSPEAVLQPSEVMDVVLGHLEALDFGRHGGLGHKEVLETVLGH
jgi:hypothetical protein